MCCFLRDFVSLSARPVHDDDDSDFIDGKRMSEEDVCERIQISSIRQKFRLKARAVGHPEKGERDTLCDFFF